MIAEEEGTNPWSLLFAKAIVRFRSPMIVRFSKSAAVNVIDRVMIASSTKAVVEFDFVAKAPRMGPAVENHMATRAIRTIPPGDATICRSWGEERDIKDILIINSSIFPNAKLEI